MHLWDFVSALEQNPLDGIDLKTPAWTESSAFAADLHWCASDSSRTDFTGTFSIVFR